MSQEHDSHKLDKLYSRFKVMPSHPSIALRHARIFAFIVFIFLTEQVDILVALQALPLQGLCLLVLPLPWAFPRLLNLQFANPLALFEGKYQELILYTTTLRTFGRFSWAETMATQLS